jgi:hypothetical protein
MTTVTICFSMPWLRGHVIKHDNSEPLLWKAGEAKTGDDEEEVLAVNAGNGGY